MTIQKNGPHHYGNILLDKFIENGHQMYHKDLYNLIIGRPGGENAMRILDEIISKPQNANQLSKALGLDYKTIVYHMKIICNHQYATREKFEKYYYFHPSDKLIKNLDEYNYIKQKYRNEKK